MPMEVDVAVEVAVEVATLLPEHTSGGTVDVFSARGRVSGSEK